MAAEDGLNAARSARVAPGGYLRFAASGGSPSSAPGSPVFSALTEVSTNDLIVVEFLRLSQSRLVQVPIGRPALRIGRALTA